jgi:Uncharacterized conserved protein (DUF2190)
MAVEERLELVSAETGADLSAAANAYKVVKLDTNGNVVLASGITDVPFGILYDTAASGKVVPVAVGGIAKAKAGATIAAGSPVATKADGTLQVAATTQYVIGVARWGGVSGDIISVQLQPANIKA